MNRRITFVALLLALVIVGRFTLTPARSHAQESANLLIASPGKSSGGEAVQTIESAGSLFGVPVFMRGDAAFSLENDGLARHRARILFASTKFNMGELGIEVPRFHFPVEQGQLFLGHETVPDLRWIGPVSSQQQQTRPSIVSVAPLVTAAAPSVSRLPEWKRLAHADVPVDPTSPRPFNQPYVPSYPSNDSATPIAGPTVPAPPTGTPPTGLPPIGTPPTGTPPVDLPVDAPINLPNEFVGPIRIPTEPAVPEPGSALAAVMILGWMLRRARD